MTFAPHEQVTAAKLNGLSSPARTLARPLDAFSRPIHYGRVMVPGGHAWDAALIESPSVGFDPVSGRLAMAYTGYDSVGSGGVGVGALTYSDDGVNWDEPAVFFAGSGVVGSADRYGVTGLVWWFDYSASLYRLLYIALDAPGYEAPSGTPRLALASAASLTGPWTRHGAIISPSGDGDWRNGKLWHACPVEVQGKKYILVNATGVSPIDARDIERTGAFVSTTNEWTGPWVEVTVGGVSINPLWDGAAWNDSNLYMTDPSTVVQNGIVLVAGAVTIPNTALYTALGDRGMACPVEKFPAGPWTDTGWLSGGDTPATDYEDNTTPFKPWLMEWRGVMLHYGTNNGIVLDASAPIPGVARAATVVSNANDGNLGIPTYYESPLNTANPYYHWDIDLPVCAGETVRVSFGYALDSVQRDCRVDVAVVNCVTNAVMRYASGLTSSNNGFTGMGCVGGGAVYMSAGGSAQFTVEAADIIRGIVRLRPVIKAASAGRTMLNNATDRVEFSAYVVS